MQKYKSPAKQARGMNENINGRMDYDAENQRLPFWLDKKNRNRVYRFWAVRKAREAKFECILFGISVGLYYFCMSAPVLRDGMDGRVMQQVIIL